MTTVLAFDPGKITGWAQGTFTVSEPLNIQDAGTMTYDEFLEPDLRGRFGNIPVDTVVVEEFILRDNEFVADLTGVRVEGILEFIQRGKIVWRPPSKKAQVPDEVLREHGLWQTGGNVNWEDGRDANDAIIHLLGHVAFDLRHGPTLRKYFKPNYGKVEL